jgi:hypothetical protein
MLKFSRTPSWLRKCEHCTHKDNVLAAASHLN